MEFVRTLLEQQPMVALFLTIAIGYLVGEINIKGFSLGVGAVLFVALAFGWFAPKSVPAPMVGTLGLALFLYAVGIQYGKEFFRGLASAEGRKANLLALIGVLLAGAVSLAFVRGDVTLGYALGLFAGAGTSTPTLQAAIQTLGNDDPAVGYSVAYPFGVAGPILFLYAAFRFVKPKIEIPTGAGQELLEIAIRNPEVSGKRLGEVMTSLPAGVQIVAVREAHRNNPRGQRSSLPTASSCSPSVRARNCWSRRGNSSARPRQALSPAIAATWIIFAYLCRSPRWSDERSVISHIPKASEYLVMHVRRGDADLLGQPDLVLEFGDRVGLLTNRANFPAMRRFFGDSIKGTAEFSYISIGIGMALGFLVGAIHVPVPGVGKLTIGLAGVLVVALVLGKLRRTGGMNWTIPISANLVLRNLGLTLFLAQVGMSSGPKFAATVAETGFLFLAFGAVILFALVLPILVLGLYVFRMPFDQVAGIVAGACGNPAILAYSNKLTPTDRPDIAYAMIFPGMTIVKILFVDIVPAFFGG